MKLIGAMYPNMAKSTHRDYFMRCMLSGFDFPSDGVHRLEAHAATDYDSKGSLCDAAIADGFPFFELLRDSWMRKIDAACQWTWCSGLRAVEQLLAPGECIIYMLDDHMIRRQFHIFADLVDPLSDLQMIQLFSWDPCTIEGHGFENPERFPRRNFDKCEARPQLYHGFNLAGDSVVLLSKRGAQMAFSWIAEFPYEFLETHILRKSQFALPGCYSLVTEHEWMGWIDQKIVGSYRVDAPPTEPHYWD